MEPSTVDRRECETGTFASGLRYGKKQGEWEQFLEAGERELLENYANDEKAGRAEYFDEKGKQIAMGEWKDDKKTGKWRLLEDGKIIEEVIFKEDIAVRPSRRPFPELPTLDAD